MTVSSSNVNHSSSKLAICLIAVAALFVGGSAFTVNEAYGAASAAPTFTAIHVNSTNTEVTFSAAVNGTLFLNDWTVGGAIITGITNGTTPHADQANGDTGRSAPLGTMNGSNWIMLTHAAIDPDTKAVVKYGIFSHGSTPAITSNIVDAALGEDDATGPVGALATNSTYTAFDGIVPTTTVAEMMTPTKIKIYTDEAINLNNATGDSFVINGTNYRANLVSNLSTGETINNGTSYFIVNLNQPVQAGGKQIWVHYTTDAKANYISDDNPSANPDRGESTSVANSSSNESLHAAGELGAGGYQDIGNRLASFSILVTNNLGYTGSEDSCYDCQAPTIESVEVSYDGEALIASTSTPVNVSAEVGDTVTFTIAVSDNTSTATIPYAGIFTNFGDRPGDMNLFYTNNFDDSLSAISSSFYEWNASGDDTAYDHSGVVSWNEPTATYDRPSDTMTFSYDLVIGDSMQSSQVWAEFADITGNYMKVALPVTLEVGGDPSLEFAANNNQKVISFFSDSILFAIVSEWSHSSNTVDDNTAFASALGISDEALPQWTRDLATWVVDDKIDMADMVVAIEYIVNES